VKTLALALVLGLALFGCDSSPSDDAGVDAGVDDAGSLDASVDAGGDAGTTDAGGDAGTTIEGRPISPLYGEVVFNEVLTDGTSEGDPNGDGDANPVEDQFVELVNVGAAAIPMADFTLVELDFPDLPRHTFRSDYVLEAGSAVVVFGGGDAPDATATATFFAANAADPGLPFGLALSVPSDSMLLLDGDGAVVARFCYGGDGECTLDAATDESLTRAPDETGPFAPHRTATGSSGDAFSVGTRIDGSPF
jgi:hypothetical protein